MGPVISNSAPAPEFSLPDLEGNLHSLADGLGQITLLNFWSASCPHSSRVDAALPGLVEATGDTIRVLRIASNFDETPEAIRETAARRGLAEVLLDRANRVADLYGAQTTPHLFLVDPGGVLRYQGAFDNVGFRQRTPTQNYLQTALLALLSGDTPDPAVTPAFGCTINRLFPPSPAVPAAEGPGK